MNEEITVEELGLARNKIEHIEAIFESLINENIIIHGEYKISSDSILDKMNPEFKRRLMCLVVDSHNPVSSKVRNSIEDKLREVSEEIVNSLEDSPF